MDHLKAIGSAGQKPSLPMPRKPDDLLQSLPPPALIATAAAVGAQAADVETIRAAAADLRHQIESRWSGRDDLMTALRALGGKPESGARRAVLEEELASAGAEADEELVRQAREVLERARAAGRLIEGPLSSVAVVGAGALAQGPGAAATGARGVLVQGDVSGSMIVTGDGANVRVVLREGGADVETLREAWLRLVFRQCGALSLAGVDRRAAGDPEAYLDLQAVYTGLRTLGLQDDREEKGGLARHPREAAEALGGDRARASVLEQLNRHRHLVLLGDPGSGKSTFVSFVALCMAGELLGDPTANLKKLREPLPEQESEDRPSPPRKAKADRLQPWDHGALVPVRIVLRDFAVRGLEPASAGDGADAMWTYLAAELARVGLDAYAPHLREEMQTKGCLVLFDGLDEVTEAEARRERIRNVVRQFAEKYPACRFLVTCRTYAYQKQEWKLPKPFRDVVLAPFDRPQVDTFVERWYAHIGQLRNWSEADVRGRAAQLRRALGQGARLWALAERPLLLTLMASLHAWRGGLLPERREELYADAVDLLLDWWESQRIVRDAKGNVIPLQPSLVEWLGADRDHIRERIDRLAFEAHRDQADLVGTADVPEEKLVRGLLEVSRNPDVRHGQIVEYLAHRTGLLIPRGVGVFSFPHRTFQEYLAACYLTDHEYPDAVAELARGAPDRWREVALLAGAKAARGTASAVWQLVDALCWRSPDEGEASRVDLWGALLAGQVLVESADLGTVSARNREKLERVRQWLLRVTRSGMPVVERALAGRVLGTIGDPRLEVLVPEESAWCDVPAGSFWMGSAKPDDKMADDDEAPAGAFDIPYAYRISRWPVTVAQFRAFVEAGGYRERRYWLEAGKEEYWANGRIFGDEGPRDFGEPFSLPNHPAVGVSWYEAVAYARWLSDRLRDGGGLPDGWQVRLPSEPEWEKAARGHADKRRFPWGNEPDPNRANCDGTALGATSAVGIFPDGASPYGAEDMSGNVWEWTRSGWDAYRYPIDRAGQVKCESATRVSESGAVVRGGAFLNPSRLVRCAFRSRFNPYYRNYRVGYRVVASPSTP